MFNVKNGVRMKWCRCIWLWLSVLLFSVQSLGSERSDVAYVTLLYGDEFLLGIRVLGKSIRDTGSNKDMVVLVSDGVSDYANNVLQVLLSFATCIGVNFGGYEWFC